MIRKVWCNFEEILGGILLIAIGFIAALQVVSRYVFDSPPAWTTETATLLFAWLVFVGASLALKRNEHFAVEVVLDALPGVVRRIVQLVILLIVLAFCVMLVGYGYRLAANKWNVTTAVLEIPQAWFYASLPFGGLLMLVRTMESIARWRPGPPAEITQTNAQGDA